MTSSVRQLISIDQAQLMLHQLNEQSSEGRLKNLSKIKVITNVGDDRDIKIGNTVVGLGHKLKLVLDNQTSEIKRKLVLHQKRWENSSYFQN